MKNILKIVFVIIGTLIGAGFASGQEIYIFFFSHGINGMLGLIVSSILMGFIIYKTLRIISKNNINNYHDFINIIIKKEFNNRYLNIKNIFNIIINIFILITFFIMVAGFGTYFEQEFNINHYIGSSILALFCFFVFMKSVKGLVKINQVLIPILIVVITIIGIINIFQINPFEKINLLINTSNSNWFIDSVLYTSYNSILLIPALITLKKYINNKKSVFIISLISVLIMSIISFLLFFILMSVNIDISKIEMPVVYAVSQILKFLTLVYGFVIISSIFTTSVSLGISFLQNFDKNKKSYTHIAAIMCITAVVFSNFGFSSLVNFLYPIFGYLGLMQIITLFFCTINIAKK